MDGSFFDSFEEGALRVRHSLLLRVLLRHQRLMSSSLSEAATRLRRAGGEGRDDSRRRWNQRRRQSRRTFLAKSPHALALAALCFLAFPVLSSAQPRPPSNNKIVTVPAGERVLEGVRFSNPSSADNLALIRFRDSLTGVVRDFFAVVFTSCWLASQERQRGLSFLPHTHSPRPASRNRASFFPSNPQRNKKQKTRAQSSTDDAAFRAVWTPRAPAPASACDPSRSRSPWPGVECVEELSTIT